MEAWEHFDLVGRALWRWLVTRFYDALIVGAMWFIGLHYLRVPWAAFWAILAGALHFIPHFGIVIGMIGPAITAGISRGWMGLLYVLILYAGIVVVDGLLIQPWLMKGVARVPFWISLIAPIALGFLLSFWWVLLVPPLLAVYYAYRTEWRKNAAAGNRR